MKITTFPQHQHLGDLVSIVNKMGDVADSIHLTQTCSCCQNHPLPIVTMLIKALGCNMKVSTVPDIDAIKVCPTWCEGVERYVYYWQPYKKITEKRETENYIACQFDARCSTPWPKTVPDRHIAMLPKLGKKLVNIGDRSFDGFDNRTGLSIEEKFEVIKKASGYVGIDSGLTHLALLTDIQVIVLYEHPWKPWYYYPEDPQITYLPFDKLNVRSSYSWLRSLWCDIRP
jgi:hypothetical protein